MDPYGNQGTNIVEDPSHSQVRRLLNKLLKEGPGAFFRDMCEEITGRAVDDLQIIPIPQKALDTLKYILEHKGNPPPGYKGGGRFRNDPGPDGERPLPEGGDYRKYDIDPHKKGTERNEERIVIDKKTGDAWYTSDHYKTFSPINKDTKYGPQRNYKPIE
jgi:guanyl-specific ribonuclease Sa